MSKKAYTIIISPSTLEPARKFTLHRSTLWLALVTILGLVVFGILGSRKYLEDNKLYSTYLKVKKERDELFKVTKVLTDIRKKERAIRKFLGLEPSSDEAKAPGQGGRAVGLRGGKCYHLTEKLPHPPQASLVAAGTARKLSFARKAELLDLHLQEINDFLEGQKNAFATLPTICPIPTSDAWVSSGFGVRTSPFTGLKEIHTGLDISAIRGAPVLAPGDGEVVGVAYEGALGKTVRIKHNHRYETLFGHLLRPGVHVKQTVKRGDIIGYVGKTGRSTGYHLHYEVTKDKRSVDPYPYILNWKQVPLYVAKAEEFLGE